MTIASMTGFARAQGQDGALSWTWELRSVNGRGLEVRCKLPPGLEALDLAARDAIAKRFKRGNISATLTLIRGPEQTLVRINEVLLGQLVDVARSWARRHPELGEPRLDTLLSLRGVVEPMEAEDDEEARSARDAAILDALDHALEALAAMRRSEGARLKNVLSNQIKEIECLAARAETSAALRPEAQRERLRSQLTMLLDSAPPVPEERLAQELALLTAKGDVREELDRLKAHIAAARDMLASGGAVGRRLDFLCQEFNREANTLCSKSGDVDLTRVGLDLKAVIEQFREQVQNIE